MSSEVIIKEIKKAQVLEDTSAFGSIMKEEIITEKKTNLEKYISTEERVLENQGMVTAIEKNSGEEEKKLL